ncbi:glycosyl transferase [bacterium]|nr:MAG: glycosyl transferase [bacterium]
MRIAVIIPVYNEEALVPLLFNRLINTPVPIANDGKPCRRTIYLVNDGSTDQTKSIIDRFAKRDDTTAIHLPMNLGKGSALKAGIKAALDDNADAMIIQDSDLEYDPHEHDAMLKPILDGRADAVIGTRFLGQTHRVLYYWHSIANRLITLTSNMMSNLNLTDIECGFKAFTREAIEDIQITELRFGVEPELIAKLAKARIIDAAPNSISSPRPLRIYEVPISYAGRTYEEGKKIGWKDGFEALWCILKHNI